MKTATLGEIADWGSGGTPKRGVAEYFGEGTPWLSIADLNDGVVTKAKESLTPAGIASSSAKVVPQGTLFVAMYGSIGKLGIAGSEMATSQAIAFAKPKDDLIDRRFLFHYLLAERPKLQARGRGGTQMNIGQADLKAWPIPLPPLPEQRRIAAVLDHANALRTQRRQVLIFLDALIQSVFDATFGSDLPAAPLGELAETRLGKMLDSKKQTGEHLRPYLRNANVQWFRFQLSDLLQMDFNEKDRATLVLEPGDVLMCEGGQPGRSAIWRGELEECYFQKALHRVRLGSHLEPEYFVRAMKKIVDSNGLKDFVTSSTIAHLTGEKLRTLPIPVPPLELQRTFAREVARIVDSKGAALAACTRHDELFASLQSRAFRGEL